MKRVIIIGASYAGLYAVKRFSKYKNIEVILFDINDYHYMQVESYGFVSTTYDISDELELLPKEIKLIQNRVTSSKNLIVKSPFVK